MAPTWRSLSIAAEGAFASIDSSTGLPTPGALSFISALVDRDPIIVPGDAAATDRLDARDGPFSLPREPDTVWSGGSRARRRTGSISVRCDLTTLGTGVDYKGTGLGRMLGAAMKFSAGTAPDTVAATVNANSFDPTAATNTYIMGNILGTEIDGRAEYGAITSNDQGGAGVVAYSPATSGTIGLGATVRQMDTWYVPQKTSSGQIDGTVALRIDGVGVRTYCYGCAVESIALSHDGGRVMADIVFQAAHITDDHAAGTTGPVEPIYLDGAAPHFRGAYATLGATAATSLTDASGTTGDVAGRLVVDCEAFSVTMTNTLTPKGFSNDITGMSGWEVSDCTVEASLTLSSAAAIVDDDFYSETPRAVMIGTGPLGVGMGMAINLPAGVLTSDASKRDISGEIIKQILNYSASRFGGDIPNVQGRGSNTPFRLGLNGNW